VTGRCETGKKTKGATDIPYNSDTSVLHHLASQGNNQARTKQSAFRQHGFNVHELAQLRHTMPILTCMDHAESMPLRRLGGYTDSCSNKPRDT
jgi:hypothetical protein